MSVMFSAREIAEAAVEKEKMRKFFYSKVCELSSSEKMKKLFRFLTEEEDRHVAVFENIRDTLPTESQSDEYNEDMQAYMDSVVDDRLYSNIDSRDFVQKAIDTKDVFRLAIGFEKDAILYFREFLPFVSDEDKKIVEGLIDEEKGHIRTLAEVEKEMAR